MSRSKPLSPHLQIYRPQLTSVLSITHRATGVFLSAGTALLVYWLASIASGPECYAAAQRILETTLAQIVLVGWTWAFFYHLCNGLRHLAWDAGYGFELKTAYRSGYIVIASSLFLTGLIWGCILAQTGGAA
ncbi:MAG: succinate dehydrogenase, cytochrome b556 subunit [Gammaproteobacteria bacterium]|nr:succinate dehydrogenase, cytochrome b556 subunit [Gammaproteobacteria bacterium]